MKVPSTKVRRDWKRFLCNEVNKRPLCSFLLEEWKKDKYSWNLNGKSLIVVNERSCISLRTLDGKSLISDQIKELHKRKPTPESSCTANMSLLIRQTTPPS